MSDERQIKTENVASEEPVSDAGLTPFVSSLSKAVNSTYSYASGSSLFCSLIPAYNRDYAWRYVRVACQWLDGYVPSLHDGTSGIMSTRIANALMTGLTKQIVGEKLIFKLADENNTNEDTLTAVSKWAIEADIIKAIYGGVGYGVSIGTSLVKINVSNKSTDTKKNLWWEAKRFDQCYYLANNQGEVQSAEFFIRAYTDTRRAKDGSTPQFFITEKRYYKTYDKPEFKDKSLSTLLHKKGDRVPMICYNIYRTNGTVLNNTMPIYDSNKVNWEEIPADVRDMIKNDYNIIRFGEEQELPFVNLGVEVFKNGHTDLSVPSGSGFGSSLLILAHNDMIMYEYAESCLLRDMYLGKGQVYLPRNLNMFDYSPQAKEQCVGGALSTLGNDNSAIQLMKGVDPEQQKAIVQQFDIRISEWQTAKENALKDIAVKWGMSAKVLASYLASTTGQQTATQVDSEDDMSIAFINLTRSYFLPSINRLLETSLKYMGLINNISVNFATPTLVNKDRLLDRITKLLDSGLINIEEAIRTYYPDASEDEIKRKIEIAEIERQKAQEQAQAEFNSFGDMGEDNYGNGNNYEDLGGDNLNGSTTPAKDKPNK